MVRLRRPGYGLQNVYDGGYLDELLFLGYLYHPLVYRLCE